jgi:hypothetical protein
MTKIMGVNAPNLEADDEIADLANKILRVYGQRGPSTLAREIVRMSDVLGIPLEEVFKYEH